MTCIYCAKKLFWSVGIHFKGSSWQLNAFVIRFFWRKPAALCDSSHAFVSYGKVNYCTTAFPACVCLLCVCVCVYLTSAFCGSVCLSTGDLCHCWAFTSWQLGAWWVKNNPVLSNFVIFWDCFSRLFWFRVRPPGMLGVTGGHFLSNGSSL